MKKLLSKFGLSFLLILTLSACGGGGDGPSNVVTGGGDTNTPTDPPTTPTNPPTTPTDPPVTPTDPPVATAHKIELLSGTDASKRTIKITWAIDKGVVQYLVANTLTTLPVASAKTTFLNSECYGWHASGGTGVSANFEPVNQIEYPASGGIILPSLVDIDGKDLFIDISKVEVISSVTGEKIVIDTVKERIVFGTAVDNPSFACPAPPPPPVLPKTLIEIMPGSCIMITPAIEGGKLMRLVKNGLPVEETVVGNDSNVMAGYKIAWNDGDSWYPAKGIVRDLILPMTNIPITQASGIGMPYLVKPDGNFLPFNLDSENVIIKINGVDATASALSKNPGLITYP